MSAINLQRFTNLCGIAAPVLWLSLIGLCGALRPEFSHLRDYISELGERGSSTEIVMRAGGFVFTGFLYLCFALRLPACFQNAKLPLLAAALVALDGVGRIGAGVFPCDPGCEGFSASQEWHHWFATIGFVSGSFAALVWATVFIRQRRAPLLALGSACAGILALVLLALMVWQENPVKLPGLFEHLATVVLSLWLFAFAVYVESARVPGNEY